MHFIPLKKETSNYSKCSAHLLLSHFFIYFLIQTWLVLLKGGAKIFLTPGQIRRLYSRAQGTLATPLLPHINYMLYLHALAAKLLPEKTSTQIMVKVLKRGK